MDLLSSPSVSHLLQSICSCKPMHGAAAVPSNLLWRKLDRLVCWRAVFETQNNSTSWQLTSKHLMPAHAMEHMKHNFGVYSWTTKMYNPVLQMMPFTSGHFSYALGMNTAASVVSVWLGNQTFKHIFVYVFVRCRHRASFPLKQTQAVYLQLIDRTCSRFSRSARSAAKAHLCYDHNYGVC